MTPTIPVPSEWTLYAACLDDSRDNYFTGDGLDATQERYLLKDAKCEGCPVRRDCLADALDFTDEQDFGIRGGTTTNERNAIRGGHHHPALDFPLADLDALARDRAKELQPV